MKNTQQRIANVLLCIMLITATISCEASEISSSIIKTDNSKHHQQQPQQYRKRRKLEDVQNNYNYNFEDIFEYNDLSNYSIRFGKCQHVKMYSDELAEDEESDTVLARKHFVLYRMCPSGSCDECDEQYGEYVVEVEEYLENMAEFYKYELELQCEVCAQNNYQCNNNDNDDGDGNENNAESCVCNECAKYENMEDNGYIDATEFIQCQKLDIEQEEDEDDEDEGGNNNNNNNNNDDDMELYIGPRCTNDGTRIIIDIFTDENCWERYQDDNGDSADLQSLLGGKKLYYGFLKTSYSKDSAECISCSESSHVEAYEDNNRDQQDEDDVLEMCEFIYQQSAKCETKHGFYDGLIGESSYADIYENQVQNELEVCTFIDSLVWSSYDETGEINVGAPQDYVFRYVTPLQGFMLTFLIGTILGLGTYAYKLFHYIETAYPSTDFTRQGGTFV